MTDAAVAAIIVIAGVHAVVALAVALVIVAPVHPLAAAEHVEALPHNERRFVAGSRNTWRLGFRTSFPPPPTPPLAVARQTYILICRLCNE